MAAKRKGERSVLSQQEIKTRRKALTMQRLTGTTGFGARAIAAVIGVAVSIMSFLAVATFDARDRIGPGFHNAVGPVGHALAETLRGLLGICAFVLPMGVLYASVLVVAGERGKRRWPQAICLALLIVATSVLAQLLFGEDRTWAHAPGGLLGRTVGGGMTALFSTVGTVVLVSAIASVALIVGTQFYFLKACELAWAGMKWAGARAPVWAMAFWETQKKGFQERRLQAAKDAEEEEKFLAELDEEEAELSEMEAAAVEADAIAEENARLMRETEQEKIERLAQKEAQRQLKDADRQQREAEKLARQMVKDARAKAAPLVTATPALPVGVEITDERAADER